MRTALIGAVMSGLVAVASAGAQPVNVSVAPDGVTPGNAASGGATISANGRYVVFTSQATNLVPADTNASADVFVRDLQTNTTTRVSVATDGTERTGDSGGIPSGLGSLADRELTQVSVSDDGNLIAFSSRAPLVSEDTNSCTVASGPVNCRDIYVHDRTIGSTTRISVATDGTQADGESHDPHISGNGRFVVFTSDATNLVAGDHNGASDVFIHDRVLHTTTRLSVSAGGVEGNGTSDLPRISADGQVVAFVSNAATLTDVPDPWQCPRSVPCSRGFVVDRATGAIDRVLVPTITDFPMTSDTASVYLSADGRLVFAELRDIFEEYLTVFDRVSHRPSQDSATLGITTFGVSGDGRIIASGHWIYRITAGPGSVTDRLTGLAMLTLPDPLSYPQLSGNGFHIVANGQLPSDSVANVYVVNLDSDGDGMPDAWEQLFGLNPADPSDAALDPDGDGHTNLLEYQEGGHPTSTFRRYLAEGAANAFFSTRIAIFNPGDVTTSIVLRFMGASGVPGTLAFSLPAHKRETVYLTDATTFYSVSNPRYVGGGASGRGTSRYLPDNDFSTLIEADHPVVVDRTMYWDRAAYGSHAETAIESPGTTWYLAEGATHGSFDLFYLFQNPGTTDANVTVTYLRPAPLPPVIKTYVVPASSRRTIWVDQEGPELAATDVSARIVSNQPIIVERSMYYSTPTQPFAGGTDGAGLAAPATRWFLAEGATGSFFDLFVLIANPDTMDAQVNVTYLLPDGSTIVKPHTIPANSRVTINVQGEDPRLLDTPVSTIVESTNSVPVLVERSMWWPKGNWYEGHLAAGSTTTGTKWALAEGEFTLSEPFTSAGGYATETYILIANTSASAGSATVTLFFEDGVQTSLSQVVDLPASSRVNVPVSVMFAQAKGRLFGTIVESNGVPIVVERAMYSSVPGVTWAAGTSALATKLQ